VGSDDTCTVWVNGELRHDFQGIRAFTADADRFEAPLVAGPNTILVRVGNGGGQWSFALKVGEEADGPLFQGEVAAVGARHRAFALENSGDPARGAEVFRRPDGPMCIRCHVVGGIGAPIGPDLSDVALKYPRDELIASILEPSKRVAEGYKTIALELDDGLLAYGMLKSESKDAIELWNAAGEVALVDPRQVVGRRTLAMSVMPDGLASLLTPQEFADLVGYLASLKSAAAK
jgi:putative heme-binding domain-containing protein